MYADDTQLYLSFKPSLQNQEKAVEAMENCIRDLRAWMLTNKLKINDSKTEFMVIGSQRQVDKVNITSITVGDTEVAPVSTVRNLGVMFDSNMSMKHHIAKQCNKAMGQLHAIRQIRRCLSIDATRSVLHAFVTSCIDYGNALLVGVPKVHLARLQQVQNMAIRVLYNLRKYDHISVYFAQEHWLPVGKRITYKICLIVYKCIHGQGPKYLADMLVKEINTRYELRSCNDTTHLGPPPRTARKTFGDRAFCIAAPNLWNSLPRNIREIPSLLNFKKELKTFLF